MRSMLTRSTSLARYGRSLGFGLALAFAGVAGCGDDGNKGDKKDAKPAQYDGPTVDGTSTRDLPIASDASDAAPTADSADAPLQPDTKPVDGSITVDGRQQVDGPAVDRGPGIDRYRDTLPVDRGPGVDAPPRIDTRRADGPELDGGTPDLAQTVDVAEENG